MVVLTKQELNPFIAAVAEDVTVYAPCNGDHGIAYAAITGEQAITFDYVNVKLSPKGLFFPQQEVLCQFCGDALQGISVPEDKFIVFGGRPCDARSLCYLDKIFEDRASQFADPYYVARRKNALIITLVCHDPAATCFCTTVGGSPTERIGSDILITEAGDDLLFEACTEAGQNFMTTYQHFFRPATDAHQSQTERLAQQAVEALQAQNANFILPEKARLDAIFEEEVWETITNTCLGCGACTYLCPTCHCFDITDETDGCGNGARLRTWDSCQYALFTKHASGHNPRVNKKQRMRQRIMHKFSYTVEKSGAIFCVGCGRCVRYCPVNLDIREMLMILDF